MSKCKMGYWEWLGRCIFTIIRIFFPREARPLHGVLLFYFGGVFLSMYIAFELGYPLLAVFNFIFFAFLLLWFLHRDLCEEEEAEE